MREEHPSGCDVMRFNEGSQKEIRALHTLATYEEMT